MLKMFRGRENGSRGGACRDSAQISRHLKEADTEALLDELMELTEAAANGDVDLEKIDAYLNALDKKEPLPFEIDTEAALTDFHNKHGLLINESRAAHRRHLKTKRTASKIAAAIAIVCVTSSLVAEACGIDVFGTIARWTNEVFHFGQNETPYAEVGNYPIEIGETKEYDTVQDAVDALKITDPLMPTWVPERYGEPSVTVLRKTSGISIHVTYKTGDDVLKFQYRETARADQQLIENDTAVYYSVTDHGVKHYVVSDKQCTKILWANGNFECRASGDLSEQEVGEIIKSIYVGRLT